MRPVTFIFILAACCADLSSAQKTKQVYPDKPVTIASDGYPGLLKTWTNYTSQAYRITQPTTQSNLLFLFDRIDLQISDRLKLCTLEEYSLCTKRLSEGRNCFCAENLFTERIVEWNITKGDPVVFFLANYDSNKADSRDPNGYARGGYRTTVMVKDPQREFFECGSTFHLPEPALHTDRPAPIFFVSQGFPNSTAIYYYGCVVKVSGNDGIRFTFLNVDITSNDTITISGTSINGTQVTYNQKTKGNLYFRHNATISFNLLPSIGASKRFAIYVEPFRVVAPSCPFLPRTYRNIEFDIITAGFSTENYDDNLNCQWKMTDLKPNAQLVLEGRSVSLERYADVLRASDTFRDGQDIRKWDSLVLANNSVFYYSQPNITDAEFSLITDGLESLVGVNAHVHILDCSDAESQHTMVSGQTLPLTIPGNNSKAYCKPIFYKRSVDVSKELVLSVNFSFVDVSYYTYFSITAGENCLEVVPVTGMQLVFSGYPNYVISFLASNMGIDYNFHKGIQMILSADPVPIETKTVCDFMEVIESSSKPSDYQEYSLFSCGGRKLVVYIIADQVSTGVISLFNGDFDVNPPVDITLGEPIVMSENISLRISTVFMSPQKFTIVISDRFLDNGEFCGGVVNYDLQQGPLILPIHYPCMAVVYGTIDHMNISSGSMELYDGFGMKDDSRKIIVGRNSTDATVIQFTRRPHVFTIRTLEGYRGNVVAKTIDANNRSTTVRIEEEKQSYYIYSSLPQNNEDYRGSWSITCLVSQYLQSRPVNVSLELLSPLGMDDKLYSKDTNRLYRHSDGLVKVKIFPGSVLQYSYDRSDHESLLFARVYASFIVLNTTATSPTVSTTSVETTTASTSTTRTTSGTNLTTTAPGKGFVETPGYLLMTYVSLLFTLFSI